MAPTAAFLLHIEPNGTFPYDPPAIQWPVPGQLRLSNVVSIHGRQRGFGVFELDIQRCTRRCAKTEREFQPREVFHSVLVAEGAAVVRYDYSQEAWDQPPENALGWWKSQMPEPNAKKVNWAPNDVMLHYFEQLAEVSDKADIRYVLALLMVRRRIFKLEETDVNDEGSEVMLLYCPKNETDYKVSVFEPSPERAAEIQVELSKLLYADAS